MEARFTKTVLRVLKAAGWSDGREVDAAPAETMLLRNGFEISPAARGILREFLGLECSAPVTGSWLSFSVEEALRWSVPPHGPAFARLTGEPLCPVGCGNGSIWLVDPSGEVVWLHDEWIGFARAGPFAVALDKHFRARYDPAAWVGFSEDRRRELVSGGGSAEPRAAADPARLCSPVTPSPHGGPGS